MAAVRVNPVAAILLGLMVFVSCNDSDEDEKRARPTGTAETANQKPGERPDADEGEEGDQQRG